MIVVHDTRFRSVAETASPLERLCTGAIWSEGPVWMSEDKALLWSDIPNNRMLRWQAQEGMSVWRSPANFCNGHAREADGSLLHCSHGLRAIVRTRFGKDLTQQQDEIVVDSYHGRRLNSPNDIVVKSDGTLWFTDPPYGIVSDREGYKAESELGDCYVFRFDPANGNLRIVTDLVEEPNGLAFSADESVLYISDTSAALREDGSGNHHIMAFDVVGGQDLKNPRIFATPDEGLPDGFRVDINGFLYSSSANGVHVYHPDGAKVGFIPVPEKVGNLTFGGEQRDELYICASQSLYRLKLNTRGIG